MLADYPLTSPGTDTYADHRPTLSPMSNDETRHTGVMFDMDGTLADTLADIAEAGNHALTTLGLPARDVNDFRLLAGKGVGYLIEHALPKTHQHQRSEAEAIFRAYYNDKQHRLTRAYPGVPEMLDALAKRDIALAVLTNKPQTPAEHVMHRVFARWKFAHVQGAGDDYPLKPDPTAAIDIACRIGIEPGRWLYVGDTDVDMQTGKAAGMYTVGVLWGFRDRDELASNGADAIIDHPSQLIELL